MSDRASVLVPRALAALFAVAALICLAIFGCTAYIVVAWSLA